jgi:uncharacterized protein with HEPN domain
MNKLGKIEPDLHISNKKQIINMRNRVIHSYDSIDNEIVWGTILRHLPILKQEVEELIKK